MDAWSEGLPEGRDRISKTLMIVFRINLRYSQSLDVLQSNQEELRVER